MGPTDAAPVLAATDFSPDSRAALRFAADLARKLDAPLHVVHVVHEPAEMPGYYRRLASDPDAYLEEIAKEMLDRHLAELRESSPALTALGACDTHIVTGLPETRILEVAERIGARLVTIGGSGDGALADTLLGSRSDRVVRLSRIPVVVVRAEPEAR